MLNGHLIKNIHFLCDHRCGHELHIFMSHEVQLFNGLVVKLFICDRMITSVISYTHTFWSKLNCWMDLCYKLFMSHVISIVLKTFTYSVPSELNHWMNILLKLFISHLIFNIVRSYTHSRHRKFNCWMDSHLIIHI